jgi:hypothetical protein
MDLRAVENAERRIALEAEHPAWVHGVEGNGKRDAENERDRNGRIEQPAARAACASLIAVAAKLGPDDLCHGRFASLLPSPSLCRASGKQTVAARAPNSNQNGAVQGAAASVAF